LVPEPGKVLCVGLNYRSHILEMGRDLQEYPTLFAKFSDALVGAGDRIALAPESDAVDWEAELVVVLGATVRRADESAAAAAIAGFTVMNDVTMRDWQFRTREWLQGKTFEGTTPLGPVLVTPDELPGGVAPALAISTMSLRIACVGGGPGGLFFASLVKGALPDSEVTVFERNRADDTFGFGVVFSDATLGRAGALRRYRRPHRERARSQRALSPVRIVRGCRSARPNRPFRDAESAVTGRDVVHTIRESVCT
jgi:hypothetical protein